MVDHEYVAKRAHSLRQAEGYIKFGNEPGRVLGAAMVKTVRLTMEVTAGLQARVFPDPYDGMADDELDEHFATVLQRAQGDG